MPTFRTTIPFLLLALAAACAPARQYGALSPISSRVTNEAIAADGATIDAWSRRVDALGRPGGAPADGARSYIVARAAAWVAYARDAYGWDPRDGAADAALAETRRLVTALERDSLPTLGTVALAPLPTSERTRQDLWSVLETARAGSAVTDAPVALADAELALVRAAHLARRPEGDAPLARQMSDADRKCEVQVQEMRAEQLLGALHPALPQVAVVLQGEPAPKPVPPPAPMPVEVPRVHGVERVVHFALNSSDLALASRETLGEVISMLRSHPGVNLVIEGFTDPRGNPAKNRALAMRRATAVRHFLDAANLELGRVSMAGLGADSAAISHASAAAFARDRRVTLAFTDSTGNPLSLASFELYDADHDRDLQIEHQQQRARPARVAPRRADASRNAPR